MYFYNHSTLGYLKISWAHVFAFVILGPIAAVLFGFFEVALLYVFIVFIPADIAYWAAFHLVYVIGVLLALPKLMRIRKYHHAGFSDVVGRFRKLHSFWP